jgi:predicted enzyme related to lactoylglutathione lyase
MKSKTSLHDISILANFALLDMISGTSHYRRLLMSNPVCHLEINAKNLARAKKFYTKLMGWKFKPMMPGYEMAMIAKNAGVALSKGKTGSRGMLPYFQVKSVSLMLKKASSVKAKIAVSKTEIDGGHGFLLKLKTLKAIPSAFGA